MWFNNKKIGTRIGISFAVVIFLAAFVGLCAEYYLRQSTITISEIHEHPFIVSNAVRDIRTNIFAMHRSMKDIVLAQNPGQMKEAQDSVTSYAKQIEADFDIVYKRFLGDKQDIDAAHALFRDWEPIRQRTIDLMNAGKTSEATENTMVKGRQHVDLVLAKTQVMIDFASAKAESFIAEAENNQERADSIIKILMTSIIISSLAIGILTTRSISVPIKALIRAVRHTAKGDLSYRINTKRNDEIGELSNAFDNMCEDLQKSTVSIAILDAANQQLMATEQQLRAANQQLQAGELQLRAANQQLQAGEQQLRTANQQLAADDMQLRAANQQLQADEQQLRAANQQLLAGELQLRAANQQLSAGEKQLVMINQSLESEIVERKRAEAAVEKRILALTQPLEDNVNVNFDDLFNIEQIQQLQDEFSEATGVASMITYTDGTPITKQCNFTDFCNIIRGTEKGLANCLKSETALSSGCKDVPVVGCCMSGGLMDAGSSISVGGRHVATWFVGQARDQKRSDNNITAYARQIGADERALLEAYHRVPAMTYEKFEKIAQTLHTLTNQLSNIAYQNVQQARFISDQRKTQSQLRIAKKAAEAANVAKSQFLANMSHEIRTPMNAIICLSEMLADEELKEEQKESVDIVVECGHNLLKLINDILDFSKIEAGELDVEMDDCQLDRLLNSIEQLMGPKALEKGLELKVVKGSDLPEILWTDPERLSQCLINLVGNAIKFTENSYVHINVDRWQNSLGSFIKFAVEDTGIGISPDKRDLIFEAFKQADGSMTRKYGGTGLGLAITKQLAGLLGGSIELTSEEGVGSVFTLIIPEGIHPEHLSLNKTGTGATVEKDKAHPDIFSGHALVAEDSSTNRVVIRRLLEKLGLKVTIVEDGADAVDAVLRGNFDVIFMDIQMPNMNGYEATEIIRKNGMKTPVIALTANAMKGDDKKCFEAGCDEYISKPVSQKDVQYVLGKYLSKSYMVECVEDNSNSSIKLEV